jgi:hypothetical protein
MRELSFRPVQLVMNGADRIGQVHGEPFAARAFVR